MRACRPRRSRKMRRLFPPLRGRRLKFVSAFFTSFFCLIYSIVCSSFCAHSSTWSFHFRFAPFLPAPGSFILALSLSLFRARSALSISENIRQRLSTSLCALPPPRFGPGECIRYPNGTAIRSTNINTCSDSLGSRFCVSFLFNLFIDSERNRNQLNK